MQKFVDENGELSCIIELRGKEATISSSKVCETIDSEEELFYPDEEYEVEVEISEGETEPDSDIVTEQQRPVSANYLLI